MSLVTAILVQLMYLSVAIAASRHMLITPDVYCDGPMLRQITVPSAMHCARECNRDNQCLGYSQRTGSTCILHEHICSGADLQVEPESLWAGK